MKPAHIPENEVDRLAVLHSINLLDTPPEDSFDAITRSLSELCDMPMSFICLVDSERVWVKSNQGLNGVTEIPRNIGFCPHTINQIDILEVKNTTLDDRFSDSPVVAGEPHIHYYAGAPLITEEGLAIGTLCVMDYDPRELTVDQKIHLKNLAKAVTALIELKKHKETRRLSLEHRLGDALEISLNEIYLINPTTEKFVYANRAAQQNLGYDLNYLKQLCWKEIFREPPGDLALKLGDNLSAEMSSSATYEALHRRHDGSTYPVEAKIQLCCPENNEYLIICNDITQRKLSEEEARENEKRYHELFLNAPDAIFLLDPDQDKFIDCNKKASELLNYTREEILSLGPQNITPKFQPDGTRTENIINAANKEILSTDNTIRMEHSFLSKNDKEIPCEITVTRHPMYKRFITVATVTDIRTRKASEHREKELMDNLANITRINSMFALSTSLSHELNQPLTAITQYCDTAVTALSKSQLDNDIIIQSIKGAHSQSMRAADIIKNARNFIGRRQSMYSTIKIDHLLNNTIQFIQHDLNKHNVKIELKANIDLPHIIFDQAQLQQVLLNLIRNSIEAMENQKNQKTILIECNSVQDSMVEFFITDTGPGIHEGLLTDLMSPCDSSKPNGLGMGLCICNFIITSNGGTFWHDKDASPGARIGFRLPVQHQSNIH